MNNNCEWKQSQQEREKIQKKDQNKVHTNRITKTETTMKEIIHERNADSYQINVLPGASPSYPAEILE